LDKEVSADKTKYMTISRHQDAGQIHNLIIANKLLENVATFTYLRTAVTYQNSIHEEMKRKLNLGNVCCKTFFGLPVYLKT